MVYGPEVQVLSRGPDEGNPTPIGKGARARVRLARVTEGRLEAVGVRPFRTKVKRRKAFLGRWSLKGAHGGLAGSRQRGPIFVGAWRGSGDGMVVMSVDTYPRGLSGPA